MGIVVWIVVSTLVHNQIYIINLGFIYLLCCFTFFSLNTILFLLGFEVILVIMYFLINNWGSKLYKIRSSFYLFLFTVFGSVFFLLCIVILLLITGTNNCTWDFSLNVNQQIPMTLLLTFALGIKLPVFPFHAWLPEVHSESDSSGSLILAGVLLKLGNYGLIRFTLSLFPIGVSYWSLFIFLLGTFGSILGSINCLNIYDMKQIIA
jgi:NADH-quinone oxidoreductase subunit M